MPDNYMTADNYVPEAKRPARTHDERVAEINRSLYPKASWRDNLQLAGMGVLILGLLAVPVGIVYIIGHFIIRYW